MIIPDWLQIIAATGLTMIVLYGSILKLPREWIKARHTILNELFTCSMCLGFWSGFSVSYLTNNGFTLHIVIGLASSASSWLYDSVIGYMQSLDVYYSRKLKK